MLGQVGVIDGIALRARVAVDEIVLPARAGREGEHHLVGVDGLARAGDQPRLDQIHHAVDEHLGVHAEIAHAGLLQQAADGVRHASDADLEAGPVLDLGGDALGHAAVDLGDGGIGHLGHRPGPAVDHVVDLARVHRLLLPVDVRHRLAGLHDQDLRPLRHGLLVRHRPAEVEEALRVHRARLDADHIDRIDEAPVVAGRLAEVHRDVVAAAVVVLGPVVAGEVPVEPQEVLPGRVGLQDRAGREREACPDAYPTQLVLAAGQRPIEQVRLAQPEPVVDPVARLDQRGGLLGGDPPRVLCARHRLRVTALPARIQGGRQRPGRAGMVWTSSRMVQARPSASPDRLPRGR